MELMLAAETKRRIYTARNIPTQKESSNMDRLRCTGPEEGDSRHEIVNGISVDGAGYALSWRAGSPRPTMNAAFFVVRWPRRRNLKA